MAMSQMAVPMVAMVQTAAGEVFEDGRRAPSCQPGFYVTSARVDQDKLERFYCCCMCMMVAKGDMARRSYLDVYTNGVLTNVPFGSCCCCHTDAGRFFHFDDKRVGTHGKAGCCQPAPCLFPHCCGLCGEGVYNWRTFATCFDALPLGFGHFAACWSGCCCACCIVETFIGLAQGEAQRLADVMQRAKAGQALPKARAIPAMAQMAMGMMAPSVSLMASHNIQL